MPRDVVHLSVPAVIEDPVAPPDPHVLRVCADPDNLPFSNDREEGFENAIARLVATDQGRQLRFVWQPPRRALAETALSRGECDLAMGAPAQIRTATVTRPYYRSTYVFVTRRGGRRLRTLADPRLRRFRIGMQIGGDDGDPAPLRALAARGLQSNLRGYTAFNGSDVPQRALIDAVARNEVDVAVAWGPLAGFFARRSRVPLTVSPVSVAGDGALPLAFDIVMAVGRGDRDLAQALNGTIERRAEDIRRILERFDVPLAG
jgi:mxaJ protein